MKYRILVLLLVVDAGEAEGCVGVDQAGRDDDGLEHLHALRNLRLRGGADGGDLAALDDDHAILDGLAGHGVNDPGAHGDVLCQGGQCGQADACDDEAEVLLEFHDRSGSVRHLVW